MGGKAEKGTPKYIANKIKAKGLQKLRWYCQMCQKQCRDENGFKCHTMSESHQRQLLLFADNCSKYLDQFSREFADGYCELLRRQFGTKRVNANKVYQDYISNREHLHMNATKWETLTEFVKWLGREGKCTVDETEKGWFVAYIDRDPATLARQEALAKKDKMDKDDQERIMEFIGKQVQRGQHIGAPSNESSYTELKRENEDEKIIVNLKPKQLPSKPSLALAPPLILDKRKSEDSKEIPNKKARESNKHNEHSRKTSALEEIIKEEQRRKKTPVSKTSLSRNDDCWVKEGIIVKIITKSLGDKYYKKKGVVNKVIDQYGAEISMLDTGDLLKLDQVHLETVIPNVGRSVLVVLGKRKGTVGELLGLEDGGCLVKFKDGKSILEYNQVSKLHKDSTK